MESSSGILPITRAVLSIVFSYLIGSIPMGYLVAKLGGGIDIREHGSGNIGMTNVFRTLGPGMGILTGVLDFFKGYLPVLIVMKTFSITDFGGVMVIYELIVIMVALFVVIGHMFPVYLLFRGGKGVATGLGVLSALLGVYIFIPIAIFGIVLLVFRYISLASMAGALAAPFTALFLSKNLPFNTQQSNSATFLLLIFSLILAFFIVLRHSRNIGRIMKGTEPKIGKIKVPKRFPFAKLVEPVKKTDPETDSPPVQVEKKKSRENEASEK